MGTGSSGLGKSGGTYKNLHKFSDAVTSVGDYETGYKGDGKDAAQFFSKNSNFDKLIQNMNEEEVSAFRDTWAGGYFMRGQQYNGFDNMNRDERRITKIYDKILDQATLDKGIEVRRTATAELIMGKGNVIANIDDLRSMEGKMVYSAGNMSTAASSQGLKLWDTRKNVEYKFKIPNKTVGAGMWIGDGRINYAGPTQREFMMNRDTVFRVGKTVHDKKRNVYVVDMEYIGHTEHDYGKRGK